MNERDLFIAALQLEDSAQRAAYLDQACGGETELRKRLDALLFAHAQVPANEESGSLDSAFQHDSDAFDHIPDFDPTDSFRGPTLVEGPGTLIGPYKLLQKLGEGGMGSVYMAEQTHPVRRRVALKVIKPGMDTGPVVGRFEAERQALAIMDHPNISRVLDAGATDTGRPFFVMDLVKGIPITAYCDRHHLTPNERLELFIPVCQAIQHAHQKGIIHRDIKPSNVLVTLHDGKPVPKVIDFGVAKAIDHRLTEKTMFTEFGQIIGTFEYMSPEQAEMGTLDVDTRSDIYSLGVMLYELLTGSTPLERARLRTAGYAEILKRIREEDPPKPSTRLSDSKDSLPSISAQRKMEPARLTRLVRGELDWIVMKSLEKDRTRRYETANGFARDIQRYLDGDPVEACVPSAAYKLKKFARKHRMALATFGSVAFLLFAATAVSVWFALWANRERRRAEDREQLAIGAVKRYGDVVRETPALKDNREFAGLRAKLLKEPQLFFKNLRDRLQADRETSRESLARLAEASFELGQLTDEIGDKQDALQAYEESLAIRERLARDNPFEIRLQSELALSHNKIGNMQSATGRPAEAMASYEQGHAIRKRLASENPSVTQFQSDLAGSYFNISIVQSATGRRTEALASQKQAHVIFERLARGNPSVIEFQRKLAWSHNGLGGLLSATGRPVEAMASFEQAGAIWERLARENPSVTDFQSDLAMSHTAIGALQRETGRPEGAMASFEQGRVIGERLARDNPSVTFFQINLAISHNHIGILQSEVGRPAEALASLERARAICERLARDNPSVTEFQNELNRSHNNIGLVQTATGRPAEALASLERAHAICERLARDNPSVTEFQRGLAGSYNNIGNAQSALGRPAEALASYERARVIWERLARDNPSVIQFQGGLARSHNNIAILQHQNGRLSEAMASYERARAILEPLVLENPSVAEYQHMVAKNYLGIGSLLSATGRRTEALASYEQARTIVERLVREYPDSADFANELGKSLYNIAHIDLREQQFDKARANLTRAIECQRKAVAANPRHPTYRKHLADQLAMLIRAAAGLGRADLADQARGELIELSASDPRFLALDARLPSVLKGRAPEDKIERIQLAYRAYEKRLYAASARLFTEALANHAKLADDRRLPHAYNAACAAALAGCGQGKDDPRPDEAAKAKLRQKALEWLKAELAEWSEVKAVGPAESKAVLVPTLNHWKTDTDLAGIRDEQELAKLPEAERAALKQLWNDVDQLLTKSAGSK